MSNLKKDPELRRGYKDKEHLKKVAQLPCSLCFFLGEKQTTRTAVHHLHGEGIGKKSSDKLVMSLCDFHHQTGKFAFHNMAKKDFENKYNIDQHGLIAITNKMIEKIFQ